MKSHKKYICFSLFKNDNNHRSQFKTYRVGAIENAKMCKEFYPDFTPLFYMYRGLTEIAGELKSLGAKVVLKKTQLPGWGSMHWRCTPLIEGGFDVCLFRDTDSRPSIREKVLVDKFLSSKFNFHSIRDHPMHKRKVMGGMWAAKKTTEEIKEVIYSCFNTNLQYGFDENVFDQKLWPLIKEDCLIHDSNTDSSDFLPNSDGSFIGQPVRYAGE